MNKTKHVSELKGLLQEERRKISLEKERSCWFEQKVNDLQAVLHEWETKDMLRKEREFEEKAEAQKKE